MDGAPPSYQLLGHLFVVNLNLRRLAQATDCYRFRYRFRYRSHI
jgi:hypothetical protein